LALLLLIVSCVAGVVLLALRHGRAPQQPAVTKVDVSALSLATAMAEVQLGNALDGAYRLLQGAKGRPVERAAMPTPLLAGLLRADAAGTLTTASDPALLATLQIDADYLRGHAGAPDKVFVSGPLANSAYLLLSQADGEGVLLAALDLPAITALLAGLADGTDVVLLLRHSVHGIVAEAGEPLLADRVATGVAAPAEPQLDLEQDGVAVRYRRLGPGPLELLTAAPLPAPAPVAPAGTLPTRLLYYLAAAVLLLLLGYGLWVERRLRRTPRAAAGTTAVALPASTPPPAAVQRLASGVAHDFDQVMQAVVGFADLALWKLARQQPPREELAQILHAGHRGGVLTRQLDAFGAAEAPAAAPIDLAVAASECADHLIRGLPAGIEVERWLEPGPYAVRTTPAEVEQVLAGLAAYALSALNGRGRMRLALQGLNLSGGLRTDSGTLPPGHYVRLDVADDGRELAAGDMARLFDPFREPDDDPMPGALDLAVAVALLRRRGGGLSVTSDGDGTVLSAFWPLSAEPIPADDDAALSGTAGETVLVVNDDPALVRMAEAILRRLGLQPIGCYGADEALSLFRADPGHYDLVLVDHLMPDMTGAEMAREVAALRPDLPVILTTGYRGTALSGPTPPYGVAEVLELPLTTHTLAPAIGRALTHARRRHDIAPAAD
jgi:signal transduction histidine kinase/CheY-like chemotaxis protein